MKFNFANEQKVIEEQMNNFTPIPEGVYTVRIEEVTEKTTRNGGVMIALKERITEGQFRNRVLFQNINVQNSSEIATRIGRETMFKVFIATGVPTSADTIKLTGKSMQVKVFQEEFNGNIRNVVKSVVIRKQANQIEEAQTETTEEEEGNFAF